MQWQSPPPMGRLITRQFSNKRCLTSLFYTSPFFTLKQGIWNVMSPSVVCSGHVDCVPYQPLAHPPVCLLSGERVRNRGGLNSVHFSVTVKTGVTGSVLVTNIKHRTMWPAMRKINSIWNTRSSAMDVEIKNYQLSFLLNLAATCFI